ncbi:hypothetical protein F7725_021251, partial [Dissostichus mawsoni]
MRHAVQYTVGPVCLCAGSREDEGAGPTGSWSNRNKARIRRLQRTGGGNLRQEVLLLSHVGTEASPNNTEALWESLYTCGINSFYLSYFQPCGAERKRENFCMHLDNIAPLSQCSCGPVPVCVSNKKKNRRPGMSFRTVPNPPSPYRSSLQNPFIHLHVIRGQYLSTTKKEEKV